MTPTLRATVVPASPNNGGGPTGPVTGSDASATDLLTTDLSMHPTDLSMHPTDLTNESPQEASPAPQALGIASESFEHPTTGPAQRKLASPTLAWFASLCTYLPLAAIAFWPVWTHWSAQLNGCNCWDQLLLEWFLHWTPSALVHGHTVLVTNYIDPPSGVNVMWNTSVVALGTLAAPLTQTIGVVHTMSILLTLSLALSASTMFLLLRRWTHWLPAAWLGGLVYGFSTFAIEESGVGRLTFAFDAIPPLVVLVVDKAIREEWSPIASGTVIGALLAVQLLISEELLAITALLLGLSLLTLAVIHRDQVMARGATAVRAVTSAAVAFVVLAGYPIWVQFTGPDRISGPPQSHAQLALFSSDLYSLVTPGATQWLDPAWANRISGAFSAAQASELTEYIGLPLLAFTLVTVALLHRRTLVRIFSLVALAAFAFSFGPKLLVNNHDTGIPGPYAVLVHLPILGDIIPSRFALGLWFGIAVVLAIGIDAARDWLIGAMVRRGEDRGPTQTRAQINQRRTVARRVATTVVALVGIGILVPLLPNWPYAQHPADVPSFFTSGDARAVPTGSLVATYPYPVTSMAWPMLWQADTDMRYRMLGGYAIGRGTNGSGTFFADPSDIGYCFLIIFEQGKAPGYLCSPHALDSSVRSLGVTSLIAADDQPHAALAVDVLSAALGARPRDVGGVSLWRCHGAGGRQPCHWS